MIPVFVWYANFIVLQLYKDCLNLRLLTVSGFTPLAAYTVGSHESQAAFLGLLIAVGHSVTLLDSRIKPSVSIFMLLCGTCVPKTVTELPWEHFQN